MMVSLIKVETERSRLSALPQYPTLAVCPDVSDLAASTGNPSMRSEPAIETSMMTSSGMVMLIGRRP